MVVLLRDLSSGVEFFGPNGLGLSILQSSDTLVEIGTGGTPLLLKAAPNEAFCSTGWVYSVLFSVLLYGTAIVDTFSWRKSFYAVHFLKFRYIAKARVESTLMFC